MTQFYSCIDGEVSHVNWVWVGSGDGYKTEYGHTFGGPPRHEGVVFNGCDKPWHLLFNLNLDDPHLRLKIPGLKWLPLYNALQYDSAYIQYRVLSDSEIQIVHQSKTVWTPDFPFPNYPPHLPLLHAEVNPPEVLEFDDDDWEVWNEKFGDNPPGPPTFQEMCYQAAGIWSGPSKDSCMSCGHAPMNLLASLHNEPIDEVSIWGGGEYVVIRYCICPCCFTIDAANLTN